LPRRREHFAADLFDAIDIVDLQLNDFGHVFGAPEPLCRFERYICPRCVVVAEAGLEDARHKEVLIVRRHSNGSQMSFGRDDRRDVADLKAESLSQFASQYDAINLDAGLRIDLRLCERARVSLDGELQNLACVTAAAQVGTLENCPIRIRLALYQYPVVEGG